MSETPRDETPAQPPRSRWRKILRTLAWVGGLVLLTSLVMLAQAWSALGKAPSGERRARMEGSAQWADGVFENPQPLWNDASGMFTEFLDASEHGSPDPFPSFAAIDPSRFDRAPASGLRATWLGHSTLLLEVDGKRFLTDPVWGESTSPLSWLGPQRWYAPLLAIEDLPPIDAVLISHDHYDHLDHPTMVAMRELDTVFVCPLGVGAHLEYWGIPAERIVELDWWERHELGEGVELVMTPSRHASGRQVFDQNRTLWAGYALLGPNHRVYFSGDTGLFPALETIGENLGPFDLTMIEVGAYGQAWPDWHMGPEQAVYAHRLVRGEAFLPVHWGLFNLAYHGWTEPIERTLAAAETQGVRVLYPRPGQSVEPTEAESFERWWPELPWRTAAEYPIRATKVESLEGRP